jgi:type II secretion system protein N
MEPADQSPAVVAPVNFRRFRENRKLIFYTAGLIGYGLFAYLVFFLVTFPKEKVQRWFLLQFQQAIQTELTVSESRFRFPLGAEWRGITLVPVEKPELRIQVDQLNVDYLPSSLIPGYGSDARFDLKGFGGEIRGVFGEEKGERTPRYSLMAEGEDIELGKIPWKKGVSISGKIRFQTEYRWDRENPVRGRGFINIEGSGINGKGLSVSGFPLPELTLFKLNGHGLFREGMIQLDRLSTTGSLADMNGAGSVAMELPLGRSRLNISMKLVPKEALNKVIPISFLSPNAKTGFPMDLFLKGTIDDPAFTLTGTPS